MKHIAVATCMLGLGWVAQAATPEWLTKEFINSWNSPGQGLEEYLNTQCQPSGLDGIQLLAVQKGHDSAHNVHLFCRQDKSATARYKVTMTTFAFGQVDKAVQALLANPNVRIGPFYFGKQGEEDGFLLVEKIK